MVSKHRVHTIYSLLLFAWKSRVLASSNTIKIRANRKPPRPSFQDRVNEPGSIIKAKIIGATNTIIVNPLECVCKEARNTVIVHGVWHLIASLPPRNSTDTDIRLLNIPTTVGTFVGW